MKRYGKSMLGVTLLEIMLVLAIAAMIIVMSIRYYQSASSNQKINSAVNIITGIVAAAESALTMGGGLSASTIKSYLPGGTLPKSPWGGDVTLSATTNTFTIVIPNVGGDCSTKLSTLMSTNSKVALTCSGSNATVVVTE